MAIEAATVASTIVGKKNRFQFQDLFDYCIPFEFNVDEDSIAAGASSAGDVTVTGAKLGDFVLLSVEADIDDLSYVGQVTAADTVTIVITDGSAATNTTFAGNPRVRGLVLGTRTDLWANCNAY